MTFSFGSLTGGGLFGRSDDKWICGRSAAGHACPLGPDQRGGCQATFECVPAKTAQGWRCRRPASRGGPCSEGPGKDGVCGHAIPPCRPVRSLRSVRAAVSRWTAALIFAVFILALTYAGDAMIIVPGPMHAGHSPIAECGTCHSNITEGGLAWLHAIVKSSSEREDSKACLTCHQISADALQPHGHALDKLKALTDRKRSESVPADAPWSRWIGNAVFPTARAVEDGVFCASCHKEHRGEAADLSAVSSARCQGCHAAQFASFEDGHPDFGKYPFARRTRTNFDHASHFGEHFEKTRTRKDPSQQVPESCADCHTLSADKKNMNVKPFETVCSSCHLHQIVGTERLSGPQGIEFLTLPGLDVQTLADRNIDIGKWPEASEAKVTPFAAMLLGWNDDRRALLALVSKLDLLNLEDASDSDLRAVEWFAWEIKTLIYALSAVRPSMVLKRFDNAGKMAPDTLARLTASLPRDVVAGAVRDWLPDVEVELMAHRPIDTGDLAREVDSTDALFRTELSGLSEPAAGQDPESAAPADDDSNEEPLVDDSADADDDADILSDDEGDDLEEAASDDTSSDEEISSEEDDVEEDTVVEKEEPAASPLNVDAQTWAEFGGWYRQEYSILYKPVGHADTFFKAWFDLSAGRSSPAASAVFSALTDKNAQGQCTKCHSVDEGNADSRQVNWGTATSAAKLGRFTRFMHEPHFGFADKKGCLSCHQLDQTAAYQKGFEDHDPLTFASNFKPVGKDVCTACHTADAANDGCLTCHDYHVGGVTAPMMSTKVPR